MANRVMTKLSHAWNAFVSEETRTLKPDDTFNGTSTQRPDRRRSWISNERSIIASVYTRLSIDVAGVSIRHVRLDPQKRYKEDIDSGLNNCLTLEANLDQGARHFRQNIASTLFDDGVAVLVPINTTVSPELSGGYDIQDMRVGTVTQWYPKKVRVKIYDDRDGNFKEVTLDKRAVAIIENPLYSVMNEKNSTLQRLIRKLNMLDAIDEQSASGKMDLIIQLPYTIKSAARQEQAEKRRKNIEFQLKDSKYGIAYVDGTEKVTQLNRPAENNLLTQVEYLTALLYSELGLTKEIMDGTADEAAMLNYYNRTINPIVEAIVEAMTRTFLTKTARSQGQSIMYFRDAFKLLPISSVAEVADKFTRNEIATGNEIRGWIGIAPHSDPKADDLRNSNMPVADTSSEAAAPQTDQTAEAVNH